jgi:hypothetical protein
MVQYYHRFLECKHPFSVPLTLRQNLYQITSLLAEFDTFTEKSTFIQKFTTPLKYSINLQKLKNHQPLLPEKKATNSLKNCNPAENHHFLLSSPQPFPILCFCPAPPEVGDFFPKKSELFDLLSPPSKLLSL